MSSARIVITGIVATAAMSAVPALVQSTQANEISIALARLGIAVLIFLPLLARQQYWWKLSRQDWLGLIAIGVLFGLHWLTYFTSIKMTSASIGAIAMCTYGLQNMVLASLIKRQTFSAVDWIAILIGFAGCVVVVPSFSLTEGNLPGVLVGISSGFVYACLPLLHQRFRHIPAVTRTSGQFFFASLLILPWFSFGNWSLLTTDDLWVLLVLGLLCTVIGHFLWVKATTELPALHTSLIYFLYVPMAMLISFAFTDEVITLQKLIGASMILGASLLVTFVRYIRVPARRSEA